VLSARRWAKSVARVRHHHTKHNIRPVSEQAALHGRAAAAPPVTAQNVEADIVVSHHNFHRPLSRTLDDRGSVSDMSTTTQFDEFQRSRQLQADEARVSDG
jgi:hypothetical protein